jgi:hypothetical protein
MSAESVGVACVWRDSQNIQAYAFKNLSERIINHRFLEDADLKGKILSALNEGAHSRSHYLYSFEHNGPPLEISLLDESKVIFQSTVSGVSGGGNGRFRHDGGRGSLNGTVFVGSLSMLESPTIIPWINIRSPYHCLTIVDEVQFFVIIQVPVEVLLRSKKLNLRIAQ